MNAAIPSRRAVIAQDHEALRTMVREVKSDLDRLQCDPGAREPVLAMRSALNAMRQGLERHFSCEEAEWTRVPGHDPSTERWIRALTAQHRDFEARMQRLLDELDACLGTEDALSPACNESIRALLTELVAHELSEDKLLQRAIFEGLDGT